MTISFHKEYLKSAKEVWHLPEFYFF